MSVFDDRAPATQSFLSPLGFRFVLSRSPEINYFVQSVTIPELSIGTAVMTPPFNRIPYPGDRAEYGTLSIVFKVDELMVNYLHIHDWIIALAKQDSFQQYADLKNNAAGANIGIFSDATLVVMSSAMNPKKQITFHNIFPISLSSLTFDSTLADVQYLQATAEFALQNYEITDA